MTTKRARQYFNLMLFGIKNHQTEDNIFVQEFWSDSGYVVDFPLFEDCINTIEKDIEEKLMRQSHEQAKHC